MDDHRLVLLNPGPVNVSERVRDALLRGDMCHREAEFSALQSRVRSQLVALFAPGGGFTSVLVSGSGTAALEMGVLSILPPEPAGPLLVIDNGVYGDRLARAATAHGYPVRTVSAQWGEWPSLKAVGGALRVSPKPCAAAMVHHETTVGLINPVGEVGDLVRRAGIPFLVDSVSGLGGEELNLAAAGIDVCVCTANKCIQGLPGVAFALVSHPHLERVSSWWKRTAAPRRSLYLDLLNNWDHQERGDTPFTPAVQSLYAFDEALAELADETVPGRIARYKDMAAILRAGFERLDLTMPVAKDKRSNTITTITLPAGVTYESLHDALRERGYVIYAGQGDLKQTAFRVANMGALTEQDFRGFLQALEPALAG